MGKIFYKVFVIIVIKKTKLVILNCLVHIEDYL